MRIKLPYNLSDAIYALAAIPHIEGSCSVYADCTKTAYIDQYGEAFTSEEILRPLLMRLKGVNMGQFLHPHYDKDLNEGRFDKHQEHRAVSYANALLPSTAASLHFGTKIEPWLTSALLKATLSDTDPYENVKPVVVYSFDGAVDYSIDYFNLLGAEFKQLIEANFGPYRYFLGTAEACMFFNQNFNDNVGWDPSMLDDLYNALNMVNCAKLVIGNCDSIGIALAQGLGKPHIIIDNRKHHAKSHMVAKQLVLELHTSIEDLVQFTGFDLAKKLY
jgi:hypothetical protein